MVFPDPGDLQVGAGVALPLEAEAFQQALAACVARQVAGHDPVQAELLEAIPVGYPQGTRHQAAALSRSGQGKAQVAGLEYPADDVGVAAAPQHLAVVGIEQQQEKRLAFVHARHL